MNNFKELLEAFEISEKLINSKVDITENKGVYLIRGINVVSTGFIIQYSVIIKAKEKEISFSWNQSRLIEPLKKFLNKKFKGHLTITSSISTKGHLELKIKGNLYSMIDFLAQRNEIITEFFEKKT